MGCAEMIDDELSALLLADLYIFAFTCLQNFRAFEAVCLDGLFSFEKFDFSSQSVFDLLNLLVNFIR